MDATARSFEAGQLTAMQLQAQDLLKRQSQTQDPAVRDQLAKKINELQAAMAALQARGTGSTSDGRRLSAIEVVGLPDNLRNDLLSRLNLHVGDTVTTQSLQQARRTAMDFDEHIQVSTGYNGGTNEVRLTLSMPGAPRTVSGGVIGGIIGSVPSAGVVRTINPDGSITNPPSNSNIPQRITIGGNVQRAKLVSQPKPAYPPLAKQARISGVVHLQAIISKDGTVQDLKVESGHPLLVPAAIEAVKNWVYQQTLLNGEPVEVSTQIDVNFTLSDDLPIQQ